MNYILKRQTFKCLLFHCKNAEYHSCSYPLILLNHNKSAFISYSGQGQPLVSLIIQFNRYKAKHQSETFATFGNENFYVKTYMILDKVFRTDRKHNS